MADAFARSGVSAADCRAGALNLVKRCMAVSMADRVLLVLEPQGQHFYDEAVGELVASVLREAGATVDMLHPEIISDPSEFPVDLATAMGGADHTLFLSRVGDYLRFTPMMGDGQVTICYARELSVLGSRYARINHVGLSALLAKLESELQQASGWHITCSLGTDIAGTFCWPSQRGGVDEDFSMKLFPVTTFKPVPGNTASGKVALSRWLMPGAAVKVNPAVVNIDGTVFAIVKDGLMTGLAGDQEEVQKVQGYMDHVCSSLGILEKNIHSWHAGINPFTAFAKDVDSNLIGWGAMSFGSPRYLHFHTTGNVPPGEIAWSIFNPTVHIDNTCFWKDGQFVWLQRPDNLALIDTIADGHQLLEESADIGV